MECPREVVKGRHRVAEGVEFAIFPTEVPLPDWRSTWIIKLHRRHGTREVIWDSG